MPDIQESCTHSGPEVDTWFDRTICPEPCGGMHSRCTACGAAVDGCAIEQLVNEEPPATDESACIELSRDDVRAQYERIMAAVPYGSIAAFRDSVRAGYDCPCTNCYDYTHPYAREWSDLTAVLWMLDVDWKTATAETRP